MGRYDEDDERRELFSKYIEYLGTGRPSDENAALSKSLSIIEKRLETLPEYALQVLWAIGKLSNSKDST